MLTTKQNILTLKGLTLRGSIDLHNNNQNLAVIFQIQPPPNLTLHLCIEPRKGIIMQGQTKIIKFWIGVEDRDKVYSIDFSGKPLKINMTMKAQYNRKIMEKYNIGGWDRIRKSFQTIQMPIVVSSCSSELRESLKQQANNSQHKNSRQNALSQKLYLQKPSTYPPPRTQFNTGQSAHYYANNNNIENYNASSNILYNRTADRKGYEKKISDKLERELEFLYDREVSEVEGYQGKKFNNGEVVDYGTRSPNRNIRYEDGDIVTYNSRPPSAQPQWPAGSTPTSVQMKAAQNQRFLQVIMLAALAGFFAALGSNLKHLLQ